MRAFFYLPFQIATGLALAELVTRIVHAVLGALHIG
jgi:hypothetical protein